MPFYGDDHHKSEKHLHSVFRQLNTKRNGGGVTFSVVQYKININPSRSFQATKYCLFGPFIPYILQEPLTFALTIFHYFIGTIK